MERKGGMGMDIIVSAIAHRTGSTLVQRMFNSRRGTLIWGEQGGIVSDFVRIRALAQHFSIYGKQEKEAYFGQGENPNTWIANMSPEPEMVAEGVVQALKSFFAAAYAEYRDIHDRIGFKEVRYGRPEIELLKECYPSAKVVLLVRHPASVWQSAAFIWSEDAKHFADVWNERAKAYADLQDRGRGIYLLKYEDIVRRDRQTLDLLAELAEVGRARINGVLNVNLNSTRSPRPEKEIAHIEATCREGLKRLGYETYR